MTSESNKPVSEIPEPSGQPSVLWVFGILPQIIAGLLITMGIITLGTDMESVALYFWTPLALLVLGAVIAFWPRPVKKPPIYKEPKLAVAKKPQATAEPVQQAAPAAAEKPAEEAPAKPAASKPTTPIDKNTVVILWGSETGTAEGLADMAASRLSEGGTPARSVSMADLKLADLAGFAKVLIITSTWGDGEPPSNGIEMWEALQKEKVDLGSTYFSVCGLGDTAYPQFCQCGKDFDAGLEKLGAKRIHPRVDCDLDYEKPFEKWLEGVSKALQSELAAV